jgi:hypothetical protein
MHPLQCLLALLLCWTSNERFLAACTSAERLKQAETPYLCFIVGLKCSKHACGHLRSSALVPVSAGG